MTETNDHDQASTWSHIIAAFSGDVIAIKCWWRQALFVFKCSCWLCLVCAILLLVADTYSKWHGNCWSWNTFSCCNPGSHLQCWCTTWKWRWYRADTLPTNGCHPGTDHYSFVQWTWCHFYLSTLLVSLSIALHLSLHLFFDTYTIASSQLLYCCQKWRILRQGHKSKQLLLKMSENIQKWLTHNSATKSMY